MKTRVNLLFRRALYIWRTEGVLTLARRGFEYFKSGVFGIDHYYLCEQDTANLASVDHAPGLPGIRYEIIAAGNAAVRTLPEYLDTYGIHADERLAKGAIAICLFEGDALAHISWLALDTTAKESFDKLPYFVNYSKNQACTGGTFTHRKFRGKNLMTYANFIKLEYLKSIGVSVMRHAIQANNAASLTGYAKFGPRLYARATYLRFLGWKHWSETQLF